MPATPPPLTEAEIVALAEKAGYAIFKPEIAGEVVEFDTSRIKGKRVRVAFVSDTHFGSRYQQRTLLRHFMRYAEKEAKVDAFIHGGDMTDGPLEMHKGMIHEQFLSTYDAQREYAIKEFPEITKPLYVISGNHDESFLKNAGGDIVRDIARERGFNYLGRSQGYVRFGEVLIQVEHPHDGISYALSYKLQRRIESLAPERKPHIYALGNYHKACYLGLWRNVEGFILPSYQAQTPFLASKGVASYIGGLIVEFGYNAKGIAPSLKQEWVLEREPISEDY
jgi:predicted phosphodiesterase